MPFSPLVAIFMGLGFLAGLCTYITVWLLWLLLKWVFRALRAQCRRVRHRPGRAPHGGDDQDDDNDPDNQNDQAAPGLPLAAPGLDLDDDNSPHLGQGASPSISEASASPARACTSSSLPSTTAPAPPATSQPGPSDPTSISQSPGVTVTTSILSMMTSIASCLASSLPAAFPAPDMELTQVYQGSRPTATISPSTRPSSTVSTAASVISAPTFRLRSRPRYVHPRDSASAAQLRRVRQQQAQDLVRSLESRGEVSVIPLGTQHPHPPLFRSQNSMDLTRWVSLNYCVCTLY